MAINISFTNCNRISYVINSPGDIHTQSVRSAICQMDYGMSQYLSLACGKGPISYDQKDIPPLSVLLYSLASHSLHPTF